MTELGLRNTILLQLLPPASVISQKKKKSQQKRTHKMSLTKPTGDTSDKDPACQCRRRKKLGFKGGRSGDRDGKYM